MMKADVKETFSNNKLINQIKWTKTSTTIGIKNFIIGIKLITLMKSILFLCNHAFFVSHRLPIAISCKKKKLMSNY